MSTKPILHSHDSTAVYLTHTASLVRHRISAAQGAAAAFATCGPVERLQRNGSLA